LLLFFVLASNLSFHINPSPKKEEEEEEGAG